MISRDAIATATHGMIDRLADAGEPEDYYKLNHISAQDIAIMVVAIETWLKLHNIVIS